MTWQEGKTYRLADKEGFSARDMLNKTYVLVTKELREQLPMKCKTVNEEGAVMGDYVFIYNSEKCFFEEVK